MKLITTNVPSFYKINLWNEVNKREPIVAVFISRNFYSESRNADFLLGKMEFEHYTLKGRTLIKRLYELFMIYFSNQWSSVIFGGWKPLEIIWLSFFSPLRKNTILVESSIYESEVNGIKGWVKKMLLKRMNKAFVCGAPQEELVKTLGFKGRILRTGGCGILNYVEQPNYESRVKVEHFLFVGRLIEVKNLKMLIKVFNEMPNLKLTIAGDGPLKKELKSYANANISFIGYIPNKELPHLYKRSDVFVLPSKSEPWGLVVEEALNNGCPVIVSDMVGCNRDFAGGETGLIFDHGSEDSLKKAILKICDIDTYNALRMNVSTLNFQKRAKRQIDVYFD